MPTPPPSLHRWALRAWWLWGLFIVYGSLVPLEFQPQPLDAAWQRLLDAPMLQIGVQGRADWVANGVLYFPFGLLGALVLRGAPRGVARALAAGLAAWLLALALALGVEFTQAFFPPRTVSRNDLLAEALGSLAGIVAGLAAMPLLQRLAAGSEGGSLLRRHGGATYAVAFAAMAMFPYDLLLNGAEWAQKLAGPNVDLWLARGDPPAGAAMLLAKLLAEALTVLPIGAWWAAARVGRRPASAAALPWVQALLTGAALGLAVELAQLAIGAGVSQGLSVLTRAAGFAAGLLAWQRAGSLHVETVRAALRRATPALLLAYLPALTLLHGWWNGRWLDPGVAWQRLLTEVHFVPFYYHYFTTEMRAVVSLAAAIASYAPVGLLAWAWHLGPRTGAAAALLLAMVIEAGRLLGSTTRPDPTNLLIAAAAAWALHRSLQVAFARPPALQPRR